MKSFSKFNSGIKYLLTVIDVFSKYGWIIPLKLKTGNSVMIALKQIFASGRKPKKLWTDKGTEFYNKDVQSIVELYSTQNEEKSSVVERWNRTMKEKMWKYFTANNTKKYIDILDKLVDRYNNTIHSSIKMTPVLASKKQNEPTVYRNLYPLVMNLKIYPKFTVGDKVRISKKKYIFDKGYTPSWTEEIFTISKIQLTHPPTYKITDFNGEDIIGTFYEQELQKSAQTLFRIEKVIRKKGDKTLVKWLGYSESFNSWVDSSTLTKI